MESEVPVDGSAAAGNGIEPAGGNNTASAMSVASRTGAGPVPDDAATADSVVRCTGTVRSGAPCHRVAVPRTVPPRCDFHRAQRGGAGEGGEPFGGAVGQGAARGARTWLLPDDPTPADAERYLIGCLNAMAVGALDARAVTVALQVLGHLLPAAAAAEPDAVQ